MSNTAIVTGAASGIGKGIAQVVGGLGVSGASVEEDDRIAKRAAAAFQNV